MTGDQDGHAAIPFMSLDSAIEVSVRVPSLPGATRFSFDSAMDRFSSWQPTRAHVINAPSRI